MSESSQPKTRALDGLSAQPPPRITPPQPALPVSLPPAPPAPVTIASQPPPTGITARFKQWWQRVRPKNRKQKIIYGSVAASVLLLVVVGGLLFKTCKVISCSGDGALALQSGVDPTQLRGEGDGRVNILLMGIGGQRHQAGDLSDTILLASIDPISKDVAMLSIPRDLYLPIPNYGSDRVNAAHAYGERDGYAEEGGPGLLKATLSEALGIPIHYWARVDFDGFEEAVDVVGGVEVDVKQTIYDYAYPTFDGGYQIFKLDAGRHYLDGATALKFARSRHTTSDFDRADRQQQVLVAIKDKALGLGTLANPLKLTGLINTFGDHFKTDLNVNEILKLYSITKEVHNEQVANVRLDNSPDNFLASANIAGASVLVPKAGDFSAIRAYVRNLFVDGFIKSESARVEVLNGSSKQGLATAAAKLLKSFGYKVERVADAEHSGFTRPVIYDYSNGAKPYTVRYLEQRFGVTAERRQPGPGQESIITVIVGSDYQPES